MGVREEINELRGYMLYYQIHQNKYTCILYIRTVINIKLKFIVALRYSATANRTVATTTIISVLKIKDSLEYII